MCKNPTKDMRILLIAPEVPEGIQALQSSEPTAMSNVFAQQVLEALYLDSEKWSEARNRLFHFRNHPCCLIDFADYSDRNFVLDKISKLKPKYVFLLGNDVRKQISAEDAKIAAGSENTSLEMMFPSRRFKRKNITYLKGIMKKNKDLEHLLKSTLHDL